MIPQELSEPLGQLHEPQTMFREVFENLNMIKSVKYLNIAHILLSRRELFLFIGQFTTDFRKKTIIIAMILRNPMFDETLPGTSIAIFTIGLFPANVTISVT